MSTIDTVIISPGQTQSRTLTPNIAAIKATNKTPYDMKCSGFGFQEEDWIASGTEYMLYGDVYNSGQIQFIAFNTNNTTPAPPGAILLVEYNSISDVPKGTWPIAIPPSTVTTTGGVLVADSIVNQGNSAGTPIVTSTVVGDSNNAVSISNDGVVVIGDTAHPGSVSFDNAKILSSGAGILQMVGVLLGTGGIDLSNLTGTTVSGSLGTITLYQFMSGNVKMFFVKMASFQTSSTTIALPHAFTTGCLFFADGIGLSGNGGIELVAATFGISLKIVNSLAAAGGSQTTQNDIFQYSFGFAESGFDSIRVNLMTSSHSGFFFCVGQ